MVSNRREIGDIAAVGEAAQGGARMRAMAALAVVDESSETAAKKMKVNTSSQLEFSSSSSRPYVQLRSQRRAGIAQQDSVVSATEENEIRETLGENRLPSRTSSSEASSSCCSRNGSSESGKEKVEFVDLEDEGGEVETSTCYCSRERRETTPSSEAREESEVVESTARPMSTEDVKSGGGLTAEKMPTESELEEFFAGPEKEIQKRFAEKYNYDIAKDEPLGEGRYEWVRLKP